MNHWKFVVLVCSYLNLIQAQEKKLPKYIEKCSLKRDFRECMIRSANKAIPFIVKGDPEYNVPNMLPFRLSFVRLIDSPQLVLNLSDIRIYGLENAEMVDLIIDKDNEFSITPTFKIPNVTLIGEYSVSGNILALSLNGRGLYSASLINGIYKYPLLIEKKNINGKDYYQAKGKIMDFHFDTVRFDLGNIFNGDPELGKQINKLLTENWKMLLEEFRPTISDIVTDIILGIFNKIAKDVPANNVFLPN